jgi:hypothetical protein
MDMVRTFAPALLGLTLACALPLDAAGLDVTWQTVAAPGAPVVAHSAKALPSSDKAGDWISVTLQNVGDGPVEHVVVIGRIFSADGRRKSAFALERDIVLDLGATADIAGALKQLRKLDPGDAVLVTVALARYGSGGRTLEWKLNDGEPLALQPSLVRSLSSTTRAALPAPDMSCTLCDWCSANAGMCGYKPGSNGQCNRPGCVQRLSCTCGDFCEIECTGADACC